MSVHGKHEITTLLLRKYFPIVRDLRSYIFSILDLETANNSSSFFEAQTDPVAYHDLLNTSIVALKRLGMEPKVPFKVYPAMVDMREVIDRSQEKVFNSRCPHNVLTTGYRLGFKEGDRGKKGMTRISITNFFTNTIITCLQAPEWDLLLTRIGVDAMLHLLTETSIFLALPNGCLCQVTGEPLINLVPSIKYASSENLQTHVEVSHKRTLPRAFREHEDRPHKRPKLKTSGLLKLTTNTTATLKVSRISPADINLARPRLFYGRPCYLPLTNHIAVGLPVKHILNHLFSSHSKPAKIPLENFVEPEPRKQAEDVRHLSKYIFPGQYGLSNPFQCIAAKKESYSYADYSDRETEIKVLGKCKTPKRLKEVLPLIDKLLWRHGKCAYKPLRDKVCPSKIKSTGSKELDTSIILELMSEQSIQLQTQPSLGPSNVSADISDRSILPFGLTQAKRHAQNKPRFIEFACSYSEVFRYVAVVTNAVIPKSFWGTKSNYKLVLKNVMKFITCRRYETLSLHCLLQEFSTSACEWLSPPGKKAQSQSRVCVSDALKRRELLEEFIFWYFDGFVLPLLKTTFCITESSAFRNQILYFRQDDWASLCVPLVNRLVSGMFEKIPENEVKEILRQRKLGFSFVRLLPKDTGVRPIVNLRRKKPVNQKSPSVEQSINQILQAAFNILTYERTNQAHLLGTSVFGSDGVYTKLKAFKAALPRDGKSNLPKLYFVKVDVQACFDTIDQRKLLEILRDLISEDLYMTQRYGQVKFSANRVKRTFVKKAIPEGDHPHFLKYAAELAGVLRNVIFVDQVVYPFSKKEDILHLLEEHITENLVKIGSHYYRQTVGIPQGSVLSALLCSFFYGDLEKRFRRFRDDLQSVMLRLIDDYLFVTTSLSKAKAFLDMMNGGHPEYGCFISKDKTLTNFDYDDRILNVVDSQSKSFPWCGYLINMTDLSVSVDYSRYGDWGIRNTLTVERGRRPGAAFVHKMIQLARAKSHVIYSDSELNSKHVIYLNIYQNFLLSAMKMHEYIRDSTINMKRSWAFVTKTIQKAIECSYSSIRVQYSRKAGSTPKFGKKGACEIRKLPVLWLGHHAFRYVLSRKPEGYECVTQRLEEEFEMGRVQYRKYRREFKKLTKEGKDGLAF